MGLNLIFDSSADTYDRVRPRYVQKLFEDVAAYAGEGRRALEIGAGTGQATESILALGFDVTALEPGGDMAAILKRKFGGTGCFRALETLFQDYDEDGDFDLVYAATAFHWIPMEIGYPKALSLLKPGGALALFWNHPFPGIFGDPLFRDMRKAYRKYRPGPDPVKFDEASIPEKSLIPEKYGFSDVDWRVYHDTRRFSSCDYIALLNTYSDHLTLAPHIKDGLEREVAAAIDQHGGILEVQDTIDLYLARRPNK